MHLFRRTLLLTAVLLLALAGGGAAQVYTTAAGYGAGRISFGAFDAGGDFAPLALEDGWVITAFGESWSLAGGRIGTRINGAFSQRPLRLPEGASRDVDSWMADANLMLRPFPAQPGTVVAPFVSLGAGVVHYGLKKGPPIEFRDAGVVYPGNDRWRFALVGGAGLDIVASGVQLWGTPLGLRLEAADHVALRSPFRSLEGERLGPLHNVRFGASLVGFGWF